MINAWTPRPWLARSAALALVAFVTVFAALISLGPDALAQSSVRPPAGATQNAAPGQTPEGIFTGGQLPGNRNLDTSDSEMWRAVRQGIRGSVTIPDPNAAQLVQSEGDNWRAIRSGPLVRWSVYVLGGMVLLLLLFYLVRGRIRLDHGYAGRTVTRFGFVERFSHWLLAVSFIILALTGLNITFGKLFLPQAIGKSAFATLTYWGKISHNYVAFAFMLGLLLVFVLWVLENFPNRYDLKWIIKGGGMFTKGTHPPAKKFNAGQKIIFWLVILGGLSLALSGIALMFPFETALFAKTFAFINYFGADLPTDLTPLQEMQFATIWHAIVAVVMIAVILAHIYIGTLGMEGAFDAMGSGEVDENWAKEHHSVWAKELTSKGQAKAPAPAGTRAAPAE